MNIITKLMFTIFCITTLISCKKSDTTNTDEAKLTPYQLITRTDWKIIKYSEKIGNGPFQNIVLSECEKDNIYKFQTNGIFELNEGVKKCSPNDPQIITSQNWVLQTNPKYIQLSLGTLIEIVELSTTSFIILELDNNETDKYELIPN